jgi:microcystin-dependent protein
MQIKVYTIDVRFPPWLKRALVFGAIPAAVLLGTVHYLRADVTVPNTFADGETLSAAKMNANFNSMKTGLDALATTVTTLQGTVSSSAVPPGTVVAFAGASTPTGWLLCDGTAASRTTYSALFSAIGIGHGGGDGTTTFNLPDYRGRFLRGVDSGTGRDPNSSGRAAPQASNATVTGGSGNPGNAVGSVQVDAFAQHGHYLRVYTINVAGNENPLATGGKDQGGDNTALGLNTTQVLDSPAGASETRPKNAYVNYIIKT